MEPNTQQISELRDNFIKKIKEISEETGEKTGSK